jgi:hypothetical protein
MSILINGLTESEWTRCIPDAQYVPHHVDKWYDNKVKSWVVQLMDVYGNQIECRHVYSKREAYSVENAMIIDNGL